MTMSCRHIGLVFVILGVQAVSAVAADRSPCKGPLRVHPRNPRYFTDGSGKAILLAGSHTWRSVQEAAISLPANPPFDYAEFLQLLEKENHNFTRLWAWESAAWVQPKSVKMWIDPLPFQRTGPGNAADGRPKFDVTKFNEAYFERLRTRAAAAGERGIYVGVMLFEGFSVSRKSRNRDPSPWLYHPLNRANNVNGLDGDLGNPLHPVHNDFLPDGPSARTRAAMGATLAVSEKVDLAGLVPDPKLSSTGYCLANAGREYLVYLPDGGEATVDLSAAPGPFVVEWFHPETGTVTAAGTTPGGAKGPWRAPFSGAAVLHLKTPAASSSTNLPRRSRRVTCGSR